MLPRPPRFDDDFDDRVGRLLFGLLWLCVGVGIPYVAISLAFPGGSAQLPYTGLALTGFVIALGLLHRGRLQGSALVAGLALIFAATWHTALVGGPSLSVALVPLYCLALGFGALVRGTPLLVLIATEMVFSFGLVIAQLNGQLEPQQTLEPQRAGAFVIAFLLVVGAFIFAARNAFRRSVDDARARARALEASEHELRTLVEDLADGVLTLDREGRIVGCNSAAATMLGIEGHHAAGMSFAHLAGLDAVVPKELLAGQTLETGPLRLTIRHRDGQEVIVEPNASEVGGDGNRRLRLVIRDVTARVHARADREALEHQLLEARRLEAVGRLAGGIAHDFNNLLTVILSSADMLRDERNFDEATKFIDRTQQAGERAAELTGRLLAFARRQVRDPRALDLNAALRETAKLFPQLVREDIEVEVKASPSPLPVFADVSQIEQIFINLVVNARDAMPHGGRLCVETAQTELDSAYAATHAGVQPGRYAMLAVTDTGAGMDKETLEHVFEPFFTTKGEHGTGLGLATVHGVIKQSGGHVFVYSEPGHGTTFKVYLPLTEQPLEARSAPQPSTNTANLSGTVLVVDDEPAVRAVAERILARMGLTVLSAGEPDEALAAAAAHRGAINLLLTDVVLPKYSGRELADRLSVVRPGIEVLFTSGYAENAIVHRGVLDAGIQFLPKPFTPATLRGKVRELLDEQRPAAH